MTRDRLVALQRMLQVVGYAADGAANYAMEHDAPGAIVDELDAITEACLRVETALTTLQPVDK